MSYQLRWVYACVINSLILVLGYFYDFQPALTRIAELTKQEHQLTQEYFFLLTKASAKPTTLRKKKMQTIENQSPLERLQALLLQAHVHDLAINHLQFHPFKRKKENNLQFHISAQGGFLDFYGFLLAIENQYQFEIENFSIKEDKHNSIHYELDLTSARGFMMHPVSHRVATVNRTPFCSAYAPSHYAVFISTEHVPLNQLKMVGYLKQGDKCLALMLLPNHAITAIERDDFIGSERGVVTDIQANHVLLSLPHGRSIVISSTQIIS